MISTTISTTISSKWLALALLGLLALLVLGQFSTRTRRLGRLGAGRGPARRGELELDLLEAGRLEIEATELGRVRLGRDHREQQIDLAVAPPIREGLLDQHRQLLARGQLRRRLAGREKQEVAHAGSIGEGDHVGFVAELIQRWGSAA